MNEEPNITESAITSLFSNIKSKFTNPFFGTLILVWLYRNWELIYTLFNFDKDCTLTDKKVFIWNYLSTRYNFWIELAINVGLALLFMVISYGLIIITRWFVNKVENKIIPELYFKSLSDLYVTRKLYDDVTSNRDKFFKEVSDLKHINTTLYNQKQDVDSKLLLQSGTIRNLEEANRDKDKAIESRQNSIESLNKIIADKESEINKNNKLIGELRISNNKYLNHLSKSTIQLKYYDDFSLNVIEGGQLVDKEVIEKLKTNNFNHLFISLVTAIRKHNVANDKIKFSLTACDLYYKHNLIEYFAFDENSGNDYSTDTIIITPKGLAYYYFLIEEIHNEIDEITS